MYKGRIYYQQTEPSDKKNNLRQDKDFSTKLNYANTKIREVYINKVNSIYNSSQGMINKLQSLKGKTKLKFYKNIFKLYKHK